jgi:hypothetical protein
MSWHDIKVNELDMAKVKQVHDISVSVMRSCTFLFDKKRQVMFDMDRDEWDALIEYAVSERARQDKEDAEDDLTERIREL